MRWLAGVLVLVLAFGSMAWGQSFSQRGYQRVIDENDMLLTPRRSLKCGTGLTCSDDAGNERTVISVIGGGGGGTTGQVGAGTCMDITGASTLFMSTSTCVEQTEDDAQQRVKNAQVLEELSCIATGNIGAGKSVTVTGRVGTCGSLASSSMTCTLNGGVALPTCSSGANTLSISAGQCWSLQLAPSAAFDNNVRVNCTLERTT